MMIDWFASIGVNLFDLHIMRSDGIWVTDHNKRSAEYVKTKLMKWARFENYKNQADIYIRPWKYGEWNVVFLDDVSDKTTAGIIEKYNCIVVQTSPDRNHVWLCTDDPLKIDQRYSVQKYLIPLAGADRGSVSGDHLGRFAGFRSWKRNCAVQIKAIQAKKRPLEVLHQMLSQELYPSRHTEDFSSVDDTSAKSVFSSSGNASDNEFGWCVGYLKNGGDQQEAINRLQSQAAARGKRNSQKYAQRTVDKAAAIACVD